MSLGFSKHLIHTKHVVTSLQRCPPPTHPANELCLSASMLLHSPTSWIKRRLKVCCDQQNGSQSDTDFWGLDTFAVPSFVSWKARFRKKSAVSWISCYEGSQTMGRIYMKRYLTDQPPDTPAIPGTRNGNKEALKWPDDHNLNHHQCAKPWGNPSWVQQPMEAWEIKKLLFEEAKFGVDSYSATDHQNSVWNSLQATAL